MDIETKLDHVIDTVRELKYITSTAPNFYAYFSAIEEADTIPDILMLEQDLINQTFNKNEILILGLLIRIKISAMRVDILETMLYEAYDLLGVKRKMKNSAIMEELKNKVTRGQVVDLSSMRKKKEETNDSSEPK